MTPLCGFALTSLVIQAIRCTAAAVASACSAVIFAKIPYLYSNAQSTA